MPARHASGYPMLHSQARALDVVARLSGVNFGSVEKVFAALDALHSVRGMNPIDAVNLMNAPAVDAQNDPTHRNMRLRQTEREVAFILKHSQHLRGITKQVLMLDVRFNEDGTTAYRRFD